MAISLFDMFKIGIGPSSSHTVGPMSAANQFASLLHERGLLTQTQRVQVSLYGSLAATGRGHGSIEAILLGLEGAQAHTVDPTTVKPRADAIVESTKLMLNGTQEIAFEESQDLAMHAGTVLPFHSNGLVFNAFGSGGAQLISKTYYSVGGGFVVDEETAGQDELVDDDTVQPYPFNTGADLLALCKRHKLSIAELMMENEKVWRDAASVRAGILEIWQVMQDCVKAGISNEGILPGSLKVKRRAATLHKQLKNRTRMDTITPSLGAMDWVNLYALAVNEENAAGGRIVTAPTNGAAGIIPAVLHYYDNFCPNSDEDGIVRFMLTAAAIGVLIKKNASISGAEVGCQGEVGSACAMAAAGLAEATGGTPEQIENAAEIGIEHNLGLTCDPIAGLVQVPCIERNAMASMKAINAATMALRGDGDHFVSLDKVIKTMRDTGHDMLEKYKETSLGGLAVNVIEC